LLGKTDIILAGDFNSNLLSESHLANIFKSLGLYSVNETIYTLYSRHCYTLHDLFLINDPSKIIHYDQVSVPDFSRHDLIYWLDLWQYSVYKNGPFFYKPKKFGKKKFHIFDLPETFFTYTFRKISKHVYQD